MSLEPETSRAIAKGASHDSLRIMPRSDSGCSTDLADLDSESQVESGFAEGRRREGAVIVSRFLAKIQRKLIRPELGACWMWTGATLGSRTAYGAFAGRKNGKPWPRYAHRLAWEWTHGPIPDGLKACHKCDETLCVRPSHLFLGTQKDNLDDARRKGRLIDGLAARKLSDDAYRDILSNPYRLTNVALAAKHGVTDVSICRIRRGKQGSTFRATESADLLICNVVPLAAGDLQVPCELFEIPRQRRQPFQPVHVGDCAESHTPSSW